MASSRHGQVPNDLSPQPFNQLVQVNGLYFPQDNTARPDNSFVMSPHLGGLVQYPSPPQDNFNLYSMMAVLPQAQPMSANLFGMTQGDSLRQSPNVRNRRRGRGSSRPPIRHDDNPNRSPFLTQFRNHLIQITNLCDISGHAVEFCCDQHGSRFIQNSIPNANPDELQIFFDEILPSAAMLMTDVFGNYPVQFIFEHGTRAMQDQLYEEGLKGNCIRFAHHMYGCRVIQSAVKVLKRDIRTKIVQEFHGNILTVVVDQHANHCVQRIIQMAHDTEDPQMMQFIVDEMIPDIKSLSVHSYSCRVLQRLLEFSSIGQLRQLAAPLLNDLDDLCTNSYGNYIVQHMLEFCRFGPHSEIQTYLLSNVIQFSKDKFASHIVEKAVSLGGKAFKHAVVAAFVERPIELKSIICDQFGNFLIAHILNDVKEEEECVYMLVSAVSSFVESLRQDQFGKYVIALMERQSLIPSSVEE
eukprot:TRINITY_DN3050_c0_g1_i1.p1 TRINITY_DN3050_c0_g1~~TRINITY_DN3050_c0_g1_i1.p1  ORF type:complete len:468 (+),score=78.06 TRINITY_DN3050_c0_g1_i1:150-1553(+)